MLQSFGWYTEAFKLYEVSYAGQEALVDTLVLERMEEKLAPQDFDLARSSLNAVAKLEDRDPANKILTLTSSTRSKCNFQFGVTKEDSGTVQCVLGVFKYETEQMIANVTSAKLKGDSACFYSCVQTMTSTYTRAVENTLNSILQVLAKRALSLCTPCRITRV